MKQLLSLLMLLGLSQATYAQERTWGDWQQWGEQPDGMYLNPIIPADYSDLDCIRVGDDYYAISSTMQFSPGMTVLHSKDLVNWKIAGQAVEDLTQIGPELSWKRMNRYGRGVWAGSIRHHKGRFYIFFGAPDEGYFMTSAPCPKGPWTPLTPLLQAPGWDDCTALWDDDGKAYFVGTHFADGYKTYLFTMAEDGTRIDIDSKQLIHAGNRREANKLIKHDGWYYLIFSEFNSKQGRYVMAKRARSITSPYEEEKQLALPSRQAHEPNQGGIVLGKDNCWYFLTHHGTGDWSGRVVSLLPVTWTDGWPLIGRVLPEGIGTMVWSGTMPASVNERYHLQRSDDFDNNRLAVQWQWNHQPRQEMYSLTERPGWLRLKAFKPLRPDQLKYAGNTLTQRCFRNPHNCVTIKVDISGMKDGQKSGLCHFSSKQSAAIGIVQTDGRRYLELRNITSTTTLCQLPRQAFIWLRSEWGLDGRATFAYSLDGDQFIPVDASYQMIWAQYRGDRIGIYNFNDHGEEGVIDIDYLHYTF